MGEARILREPAKTLEGEEGRLVTAHECPTPAPTPAQQWKA